MKKTNLEYSEYRNCNAKRKGMNHRDFFEFLIVV